MSDLLAHLAQWAADVVYYFGYPGVAVLMVLSNLHLPIPSQLVLPFAGFLVGEGHFSFFPMLAAATAGALAASLVLYFPGRLLGEERLRRFVGRSGGSCSWTSRTSTRRASCSSGTAGRPS